MWKEHNWVFGKISDDKWNLISFNKFKITDGEWTGIRLNIQSVWTGAYGVLVWKKTALNLFLPYVSQTSDCGLYFLSSLAKNNEENW